VDLRRLLLSLIAVLCALVIGLAGCASGPTGHVATDYAPDPHSVAQDLYGSRMLSASFRTMQDGVFRVRLEDGKPGTREPYKMLVALSESRPGLEVYQVEYADADERRVLVYHWDARGETVELTELNISGLRTMWPRGAASGMDQQSIRDVATGERSVPSFKP